MKGGGPLQRQSKMGPAAPTPLTGIIAGAVKDKEAIGVGRVAGARDGNAQGANVPLCCPHKKAAVPVCVGGVLLKPRQLLGQGRGGCRPPPIPRHCPIPPSHALIPHVHALLQRAPLLQQRAAVELARGLTGVVPAGTHAAVPQGARKDNAGGQAPAQDLAAREGEHWVSSGGRSSAGTGAGAGAGTGAGAGQRQGPGQGRGAAHVRGH